MQNQVGEIIRNKAIYQKVADAMAECGYSCTWQQCRVNAGLQYVAQPCCVHDSERQPTTINGFVNYFHLVFHVVPCCVANATGIDLSSIPATVQLQSLCF